MSLNIFECSKWTNFASYDALKKELDRFFYVFFVCALLSLVVNKL